MFAARSEDDSRVKVNFIYRWAFDPDCCYWFELVVCDVAFVDAVACSNDCQWKWLDHSELEP